MTSISFRAQHRFGTGFAVDVAFATSDKVVALFGPSGTGKSTVLSMFAGFLRPDRGFIQVGDQVFFDAEEDVNLACEKRNVGLVAQGRFLFPHLDVQANLLFGCRFRGSRRGAASDAYFQRICGMLRLGALLKRAPRNLSGGERQRVALGRALMTRPKLLLLDEPLSALDEGLEAQVLNHLEEVIDELRVPVVLVSHRQSTVRRLADWVVVLEEGHNVAEGTPDVIFSRLQPNADRPRAAPMNWLVVDGVRWEREQWRGRVGDQRFHLPAVADPPTRLFVQFVPQDVTLSREDVRGLSAQNRLRGAVTRVETLPGRVLVAVDVGQTIWAEVSPNSARVLELEPGVEVVCLIKSQSLDVIA